MDEWPYRPVACAGFFAIALLAWLTGRRTQVNVRTIAGSLALAWGLGLVVFGFPGSRWVLAHLNDLVVAALTASQKGSVFLLHDAPELLLSIKERLTAQIAPILAHHGVEEMRVALRTTSACTTRGENLHVITKPFTMPTSYTLRGSYAFVLRFQPLRIQ